MLQPPRATKLVLSTVLTASLAAAAWADEYTVFTGNGSPVEPDAVASVVIGQSNDDVTQDVTLPFWFPYFGRLFDRVTVCSNGWAALVTTSETVSVNPALPSASAPNAVLAPLWDDLSTGGGTVRTYTNGVAPARVFVIDWSGVQSFDASATGLRFQVALFEGTGVVQFAYGSGGTWSGLSYTAGIEDPTGTIAYSAAGTGNDLSAQPTGTVLFQPRTVVVDGRLLRDRPVADASGLGNTTQSGLPVAGATLRLVREDTDEVAAVGLTASDGTFALTGPGLADTVALALEVATEGAAGRVIDGSGDVYRYSFESGLDADPFVSVGTVTLDAAVDTFDDRIRRALNVQQVLERARRAAVDAAAWGADNLLDDPQDTVPALDVTWVPGTAPDGMTTYVPSDGATAPRMSVAEGTANPDAYDDDVILREYGQHVLASLSVHAGALPSPRDFAAQTSPAFAWVDGFGYLFAAGVQGSATLVDTISSTVAVVDDLEEPPEGARGEGFPSAVAGSLWDLVDPANENEDELAGTLGPAPSTFVEILATVDVDLDVVPEGSTEITIRTFLDAWRERIVDDETARRATARVFVHHGTLPDDDAEPNDRIDEATALGGPGSKVTDRKLSPDNADVYELVVPDPDPQTVEIALQQTTDVDLRLALLDVGGQVIVETSNLGVGGSSRQTLRLQPVVPLPPGTYYVRVDSAESGTGEYALSVFRPLLLSTGDLPEWTVGVPIKIDFFASGGIEPYTFDTLTDAPGLGVVNGGTRLTGIPLEAGDYDVDVTVTDSAEPAGVVNASRPLIVNPPPTLPVLFGVAEGRTGSRVLGTGGTGTVWTPLVQPPNALSLVGGADLRLEGDSGAPTSFVLSADADDAVGASLDAASTFVVVTADLATSDGSTVPGDDAFGYFLDALAGSDIDVTLKFRGTGETPLLANVLDDAGNSLTTGSGRIEAFGRKLKIRDVVPSQTGRAHLVFTRNGFEGTVSLKTKVKPPRRVRGQGGVFESGDVVEVPIDVLAGARVRIALRRQAAPASLEPTVLEVVQPNGVLLALPSERRRGRKRAILKFDAAQDGRYVLRFTGRDLTTGPLFYDVRIRTPRSARLVLD